MSSTINASAGALRSDPASMILILRRLLTMLTEQRARLLLLLCASVLQQLLFLASSMTAALGVGLAIGGAEWDSLVMAAVALLVIIVLRAVVYYLEMWIGHNLAYRTLAEMRISLYRTLARRSLQSLLAMRTGDLSSVAMNDVNIVEFFYAHIIAPFIASVTIILVVAIVLASLHPLLLAVVLPPLIAVFSIPVWASGRAHEDGRAVRLAVAEAAADSVDDIQGLREITFFNRQDDRLRRMGQVDAAIAAAQVRHAVWSGQQTAWLELLSAVGGIGGLVVGGMLVGEGQLSIGFFPMVSLLSIYAFKPVGDLIETARDFGLVTAAANRYFAEFDHPVEQETESRNPIPQDRSIVFDRVRFTYPGALKPALSDVTLAIREGETVAIVGRSGAGKTTLASLLQRLWRPDSGVIRIGETNIQALALNDLRCLISVVPQEPYLFRASIAENIALGEEGWVDTDRVRTAARVAQAHEFVSALPKGYDTMIGERGVTLSGGQRQRIAIARAIYRQSPILILDEAVANLDAENDRLFHAALKAIPGDRTCILIAHRLSTIKQADRIAMIADGRVVEFGSYEGLLRDSPSFRALIRPERSGMVPARRERA